METSSPSVKEGEGFPTRNTWSGQVNSESFAQVVKKKQKKEKTFQKPRKAFQPPKISVMCCMKLTGTMLGYTKV